MPADEYASTVRGGLKLKGGAPAGVKKKKKKVKASTTSLTTSTSESKLQAAFEESDKDGTREFEKSGTGKGATAEEDEDEGGGDMGDMKTASERAHEEVRRKRLHNRLEKEGVKSHKQRVEELNKYLSKLSEHHDMPRIGPG